MLRTRFAPSPTGDLHLGGAWTALASWALARASGGKTVLRLEDIDTPRVVRDSSTRITEDLAWLGLDWDEGPEAEGPHAPYTQSQRIHVYDAKLAELAARGLVYPCDCSRAEIGRAASAPHAGEELVYPGTCRDLLPDRPMKRSPALRLRISDTAPVVFDDLVRGRIEERVDLSVGDFVLRRGDGAYAYQLVVAIDDDAMGISHVVRAADLLASTARQLLLLRLLGTPADLVPAYAHVPMVVAAGGDRLAKRLGSTTIRTLRDRGITALQIIGHLAHGLALVPDDYRPMTPSQVASALQPLSSWRTTSWLVAPDLS